MNEQLESRLRFALGELASELPAGASAGVLASGYRPRTHSSRSAVVLAGIVVAAGMALAISLLSIGASTPRAFAGWTPTPAAPIGAHARKAEEECRSGLLTSSEHIEAAEREAKGSSGRPWPIPAFTASDWQMKLVDTRGPYTVVLFVASGGRAETSCFSGPKPRQGSAGGSFGTHPPPPVPAGKLAIVSSGSNTTPPDEGSQQFSRIVGRTGAGVRGVTVVLAGGERVRATVRGGWFLAWWPGRKGLVAVEPQTSPGVLR